MHEVTARQALEAIRQAAEKQSTGPGKAHETDISRFQDVMKQDSVQEASAPSQLHAEESLQAEQIESINTAEHAVAVTDAEATQGNKILDNLDKMSCEFKDLKASIDKSAENHGEMGDIIRLQMQVAEVTTNQTLVGKTGEKSGQGVNQLVRGQ
ncbi:hypothetical protein [Halodesulfovibrio sp.]|uniref:hypothetical protein n=1 Tax=Halodesulfovibrio sp. TaxID=1912772 RepID=UPI0025C2B5DB|nr:hypothetical protein [Halodesulfovibrio sp.]